MYVYVRYRHRYIEWILVVLSLSAHTPAVWVVPLRPGSREVDGNGGNGWLAVRPVGDTVISPKNSWHPV